MKLIYKHDNILVLYSAKNVLALNGIDAFVKSEHISSWGARFGISNIFHELWLQYDQDYGKASTIIENEIESLSPTIHGLVVHATKKMMAASKCAGIARMRNPTHNENHQLVLLMLQ